MRLDDLGDMNWVKSNFSDFIKAKNIIDSQFETLKNEVKLAKEDTHMGGLTLKYSSFKKLKPKNLETVMNQYPIAEYPNLYNISLSKEAQHIITDESLFDEVDIEMVRVELPE